MKYAMPLSLVCLVVALTAALFGFTDLDPKPLLKGVFFFGLVGFAVLIVLSGKPEKG